MQEKSVERIEVVLEHHTLNTSRRALIDATLTIRELAPRIAKALGLPPHDASGRTQVYRLVYDGRQLQDHETFAGIQPGQDRPTLTVVPEMVAGSGYASSYAFFMMRGRES
jgi:hypothetical protein